MSWRKQYKAAIAVGKARKDSDIRCKKRQIHFVLYLQRQLNAQRQQALMMFNYQGRTAEQQAPAYGSLGIFGPLIGSGGGL